MKTAIKVALIKACVFITALLMVGFGLFASIAIFAESVEIILTMGLYKRESCCYNGMHRASFNLASHFARRFSTRIHASRI